MAEDVLGREFGDGSNRWIPGAVETLRGEGKNDVAGVLDAAALNFDEGVGGWVSLLDSEPGNSAGPGDSNILSQSPTAGGSIVVVAIVVAVIALALWLIRPLLSIVAELS